MTEPIQGEELVLFEQVQQTMGYLYRHVNAATILMVKLRREMDALKSLDRYRHT